MFPRTALVIVALFAAVFAVVVVRGAFVAEQAHCIATCNRGIAGPYQQLLTRMRELADAGQTDELRALITRAQERSREMERVCGGDDEQIYLMQVRDLTE